MKLRSVYLTSDPEFFSHWPQVIDKILAEDKSIFPFVSHCQGLLWPLSTSLNCCGISFLALDFLASFCQFKLFSLKSLDSEEMRRMGADSHLHTLLVCVGGEAGPHMLALIFSPLDCIVSSFLYKHAKQASVSGLLHPFSVFGAIFMMLSS